MFTHDFFIRERKVSGIDRYCSQRSSEGVHILVVSFLCPQTPKFNNNSTQHFVLRGSPGVKCKTNKVNLRVKYCIIEVRSKEQKEDY